MEDIALFQQAVQHIGEYLERDVSHLTMSSRPAVAIPGLDSLKMFEMILYLEECFKIQFDETVMEKIDTMGDLVSHIKTLQSEASHTA